MALELLKSAFPKSFQQTEKESDGIPPSYLANLEGHLNAANFFSDQREPKLLRRNIKDNWVFTDGTTHQSAKLFNIIMDRNHEDLYELLSEQSMEILKKPSYRPVKKNLFSSEKFNAINLACNGFCFSFFQALGEETIIFDLKESLLRDNKELLFFNWSTACRNPLAEDFFSKLKKYVSY